MCEHLKLPGFDGTVIVCGLRRTSPHCRVCGRTVEFECDWKVPNKVPNKLTGTCDAPLCRIHALQVGPGKHLCPTHQKSWDAWKSSRSSAGPSFGTAAG